MGGGRYRVVASGALLQRLFAIGCRELNFKLMDLIPLRIRRLALRSARSSCRRLRGDIGCGAFMALLSSRCERRRAPIEGAGVVRLFPGIFRYRPQRALPQG